VHLLSGGKVRLLLFYLFHSQLHNLSICVNAEYDNSSVGEQEKFAIRHVRDAFVDWQVCCLQHFTDIE
jgi:hypothetical protein